MLRPTTMTNDNQGTMRIIRPRGSAELNKLATVELNPQINIKHYFRSAAILIKQARVYYNEGDYENAYLLFLKYTNLGVSELCRHPSYNDPEYKRQNKTVKLNCLEALDALEVLKPKLDKLLEEHLADMNYPSTPQSNPSPREMNNPSPRRQESSGSPSTNRKPKAPSASTSSSRKIGEKIQVEEKDKKIKIKPVNDEKAQTQVDQEEKPKRRDTEPWSMQNALRGVAGVGPNIGGGTIPSGIEQNKRHDSYSSQPQYPTTTFYNQSDSFNYIKSPVPSAPPYAPPLPPKPIVDEPEPITTSPPSSNGPPLPPKIKDEPEFENEKSPLDNHIKDQLVPKLPPKIGLDEQEESHSLPASMTEGGMPLRYLYLPDSLQQDFLRIAHVNTSKNIETCGILCGTLKNNILRVTTMIIPRQSGTPDSCTTENEEELFDYQDSHELLTFGWIHTHPSQSCFLSSLDLHTHCSYQIMLPEAVAIVCSPKHDPSYGIFRLTDPPGLPLITNCRAEGAFHPHPDEPIYTDTHNDTGHVRIKDYTYEIVDLRG